MIPPEGYEYVFDTALLSLSENDLIKYLRETEQTRAAEDIINAIYKDDRIYRYIDYSDAEYIFNDLVQNHHAFIEHPDKFADSYFEISNALDNLISSRSSDPSTPLAKTSKHGLLWIDSALSQIFSEENIVNSLGTDVSKTHIPASDRVVRRNDNEDAWTQAEEGVIALRDAMIVANDFGGLDDDEFEQKLSEVRALQIMLDAPQIQWEVLDQLTTKTVKYLAMKFADNAIGLAATGLIVYLTTLLQGTL